MSDKIWVGGWENKTATKNSDDENTGCSRQQSNVNRTSNEIAPK